MSITRIGQNVPSQDNVLSCLEEAKQAVSKRGIKKAVVLLLEDEEGYNHSFLNAGMKMSEILALLRVSEGLVIKQME